MTTVQEIIEGTNTANPFNLPPQTERVLMIGERDRVLHKLSESKDRLTRMSQQGISLARSLNKQTVGSKFDREGTLSSVRRLGSLESLANSSSADSLPVPSKVTFLSPVINKRASLAVHDEPSPFLTETKDCKPRAFIHSPEPVVKPLKLPKFLK
jgi:hypothetical protein